MEITVLYFASYKDKSGINKEYLLLELTNEYTISDILEIILTNHPNISTPKDKIVVAINEEYQTHEYKINDGDIIALIPPVSGG
ncbi:MAG: MoaD/ThiS family protein [Dehalococcoidia bacterium]